MPCLAPDHMPNMLDLELLEGELRAASGDSGTPCNIGVSMVFPPR
jgi:hypothetical protein